LQSKNPTSSDKIKTNKKDEKSWIHKNHKTFAKPNSVDCEGIECSPYANHNVSSEFHVDELEDVKAYEIMQNIHNRNINLNPESAQKTESNTNSKTPPYINDHLNTVDKG